MMKTVKMSSGESTGGCSTSGGRVVSRSIAITTNNRHQSSCIGTDNVYGGGDKMALEDLYNSATWNMYDLIIEYREKHCITPDNHFTLPTYSLYPVQQNHAFTSNNRQRFHGPNTPTRNTTEQQDYSNSCIDEDVHDGEIFELDL